MNANTLFLRLEGAMQAWGAQESKFLIRRTMNAPTRSGVLGLLCAALGVPRSEAPAGWLPRLGALRMGVRIDLPGIRWWDFHTVGARMKMRIAKGEGKTKDDAMLTRREYLCDASFLVALQGDPELIGILGGALARPKWTICLGRRSCPPCRPVGEHPPALHADLLSALSSVPWRRRLPGDSAPSVLNCLLDWSPTEEQPTAPLDAIVWYDVPVTLEPPSHGARFVVRHSLSVGVDGDVKLADGPAQHITPRPPRRNADYTNTEYKKAQTGRLESDEHLCIFCKQTATTVQHITYRRAGGRERHEDLRSLCRICHDAVTMIEYGLGMGLDRINPEDPKWRDRIIEKRGEILRSRSLEMRRRSLERQDPKLAKEEID